ncbi:MAG TPA: hypothetical protein PLX35_08935 [Cyclobacteriaceae bacterium]|nr:hypothetical protein [Cyclobacteriaceae bacterium]
MEIQSIRLQLLAVCNRFVAERILAIEHAIAHAQASAAAETKSSMGDKYETARAMAQQEADHSRAQLADAMALRSMLDQYARQTPGDKIKVGSIVYTSQHNYFIAIPVGAVQVGDESFLVISSVSPIGKLLMGKTAGDQITWQGKLITVQRVQ